MSDVEPKPKWPEDHPGRHCSECGVLVYPIWIDDTPPPGTCPEGASCAKLCLRVRESLRLAAFMAEQKPDKQMHPAKVALMHRAGLTGDDVADDESLKGRIQAARYQLSYGVEGGQLPFAEPLLDWLREDPEPRVLALMQAALMYVDWADGKRTLFEIGEECELFQARAKTLIEDMAGRDYEPGE